MNSFYTNDFLSSIVKTLDSTLNDLETWSAYNDDRANEEILALRVKFDKLVVELDKSETK